MKRLIAVMFLLAAPFGAAFALADESVWREDADVLILGEFHDNPHHHDRQLLAILEVKPAAVVYEMLTADEAAALADVPRHKDSIEAATRDFHWSNIADYTDLLMQSEIIIGAALPRDAIRAAFRDGSAEVFGSGAPLFGLDEPLEEDENQTRKKLQFDAHCAAMPMEMMGGMVDVQRLKDASFARSVLAAFDKYGGPVILITGNGHARTDWGVPAYLARARPNLRVLSVGQYEENGQAFGQFTSTLSSPSVERGDPCAAFN